MFHAWGGVFWAIGVSAGVLAIITLSFVYYSSYKLNKNKNKKLARFFKGELKNFIYEILFFLGVLGFIAVAVSSMTLDTL